MDSASETPRRILLIDDSEFSRRVVRAHLRAEGMELLEASDGREGAATAARFQPDLILLDITMPGWDGFDTIRHLKEDPNTRAIAVMFVSAKASTEMKAKGLDLGAVDFISKPFDPIELRARVRAALRSKYILDLLEQRAHLDGLTGLGNRHALGERLAAEWSNCIRRGASLALMIADLDRFKAINDRHGHAVGDTILQGTARVLREVVRGGDFVARFGGEEFVVLAPGCELAGALAMANRFRFALSRMREPHNPLGLPVTASVGVAVCNPDEDVDPNDLLRRADQALYQAKAAGRDNARAWEETPTDREPGQDIDCASCSLEVIRGTFSS